ncbi:MAG: hypothetical protein M3070_05640 [Actinomycetota bacterium]|nr:hypothetical protein [Actinomycetota bacterium]
MAGRMMQTLAGADTVLGLALLARPETLARAAGGRTARVPAPWIPRLLGGRLLAQGVIASWRPSRTVALGGAAVDAAHSLSMVAAAVAFPQYRRIALASAALAGLSAGIGALAARTG